MICLGYEASRPKIQRLSWLLLLLLLWLLLFYLFLLSLNTSLILICFTFFLVFVHFFLIWVPEDVISSIWNSVDAAMSFSISEEGGVLRSCQRLRSYGFNWGISVDRGSLNWNLSIVKVSEGSLFICVFGNLSNITTLSIHISTRCQIVLHKMVGNFKLLACFAHDSSHKWRHTIDCVLDFGLRSSYIFPWTPRY